jgi:hypothetical protein
MVVFSTECAVESLRATFSRLSGLFFRCCQSVVAQSHPFEKERKESRWTRRGIHQFHRSSYYVDLE